MYIFDKRLLQLEMKALALCKSLQYCLFSGGGFFYSNKGKEPIHKHAEKGDMECKFWLLLDEFEIQEAYSFELSVPAK